MIHWNCPNRCRLFFSTLLLAAISLTLLSAPGLAAPPVITIDADGQYDYAGAAFIKRDYNRAIAEFQRFIDFFPGDPRTRSARLQIGMALFETSRYVDAIEALRTVTRAEIVDDLSVKAYHTASECYLKKGQVDNAVSNLEQLAARAGDHHTKDRVYYTIGWIFLERLEFETAESYFNKVRDGNQEPYDIQALFSGMDSVRSLEQKDPATAGLLSLIPGAGYLYIGRYQDALISFLVNGALIFAAYEAIDNDLPVLGGLVSLVELGFYAGNIYGATMSTHKENRSRQLEMIEKLKQRTTIGFHRRTPSGGIQLSFNYRF